MAIFMAILGLALALGLGPSKFFFLQNYSESCARREQGLMIYVNRARAAEHFGRAFRLFSQKLQDFIFVVYHWGA